MAFRRSAVRSRSAPPLHLHDWTCGSRSSVRHVITTADPAGQLEPIGCMSISSNAQWLKRAGSLTGQFVSAACPANLRLLLQTRADLPARLEGLPDACLERRLGNCVREHGVLHGPPYEMALVGRLVGDKKLGVQSRGSADARSRARRTRARRCAGCRRCRVRVW